jgi:hypothetical protein
MSLTIEELTRMNPSHVAAHGPLTPDVLERIRRVCAVVEARTARGEPAEGDVVVLRGTNKTYPDARMQGGAMLGDETGVTLAACQHPSTPYIAPDGSVDISGGPWRAVAVASLRPAGQREAAFWTWRSPGHHRAAGGVTFRALVNVWEYESDTIS